MFTMFATDATGSEDDRGNWAIGRNLTLCPWERLETAAATGPGTHAHPRPNAVQIVAMPLARLKDFMAFPCCDGRRAQRERPA
jgi:hypothetical protein